MVKFLKLEIMRSAPPNKFSVAGLEVILASNDTSKAPVIPIDTSSLPKVKSISLLSKT